MSASPISFDLIGITGTSEDLHNQRQAQQRSFGRLDAVALSLSSEEEAGLGFVIDARS